MSSYHHFTTNKRESLPVLIKTGKKLPKSKRRTITVNHGKEFANHREIYAKLGCKVYFADPHLGGGSNFGV